EDFGGESGHALARGRRDENVHPQVPRPELRNAVQRRGSRVVRGQQGDGTAVEAPEERAVRWRGQRRQFPAHVLWRGLLHHPERRVRIPHPPVDRDEIAIDVNRVEVDRRAAPSRPARAGALSVKRDGAPNSWNAVRDSTGYTSR